MTKTERIASLEAEVARLHDENAKLVEALLGMARMATPPAPYVVGDPVSQPWVPQWQPTTSPIVWPQPLNVCSAN